MGKKFTLNHKVEREELKTSFGIVGIDNIFIDLNELDKYITEIFFNEENLKFIFLENNMDEETKINIYNRFIPEDEEDNLDEYISESLKSTKGFYSFFAEGLLTLIYRDIYNYKLASAVINIEDTLNDSHTGVDACMINTNEKHFVLGEAKFYKSYQSGINKIINDFTKQKGFKNKLESLKRKVMTSQEGRILLKNLKEGKITKLSLKEFLEFDIDFCGFVLHNHEGEFERYLEDNFYDNIEVTVDDIEKNILQSVTSLVESTKHRIVLLHLPIKDKKVLIKKVIEKSIERLDELE